MSDDVARESVETDLWNEPRAETWQSALARYTDVIAAQEVRHLAERDRWYQQNLPKQIAEREPAWISLDELDQITEWKMARGVWRQRNLLLVRSNPPERVLETSQRAFAQRPEPLAPIATLAKLAGVGPATASAVLAAASPESYPFLDEIVAAQVPDLGKTDFTLSFYGRYAMALRERARRLGDGWTPALVERALWANAGGKARIAVASKPAASSPNLSP